ncbi:MAG: hypothetical protein KDC92_09815, partial [Bacteroidetes bacterium]|nr:hypothetical protein [Bacteroidota bacterium]
MNALSTKKWDGWVWLIFVSLLGYVGLSVVGLLKGIPLISALPFALALCAFAFFKPKPFWFFLVFVTPFSLQVDNVINGSSINLPNEPYIIFLQVLLIFKFLIERRINWRVLSHPITIIIIAQLVWMLVASSTSSIPMVSFKYLLSRFWYVVVFFFFGIEIFRKRENLEKYIWYACVSLSLLIIYTLVRHSQEHFSHAYSYYAALPFFKDHNIYAVIVAFFIPPLYVYAIK